MVLNLYYDEVHYDERDIIYHYILTGFNNATLTSLYIFQKTVECKPPLLRLCHHELASSAKTLILTVHPNLRTLQLIINLGN